MAYRIIGVAALIGLSVIPSRGWCYPKNDAAVGLESPALVTVYPDDSDPNLYYFLPTQVELVRNNDEPRFGVQHWGFSKADKNGIGAALTFSVRPAYDQDAIKAVAEELKKKNPNARWAAMPLLCSRMEVIINGKFYPQLQETTKAAVVSPENILPSSARQDPAKAVQPTADASKDDGDAVPPDDSVKIVPPKPLCEGYKSPHSPISVLGGSVDSTEAFSIEVTDLGGRALSQGTAPDSDVVGAMFTYVFRAVGKRLHARVTVKMSRFYEHHKHAGNGSGWFGMVKSGWSAEYQKLQQDGTIKLEILDGGVPESGQDYMAEIFKTLVNARIKGEGMFKPELKAAGLAGAPEASNAGWGFSGSHGWEQLDEKLTQVFEIDRRSLEEREFSTGLSFSAVCAQYKSHFVDLSTQGGQCINMNRANRVQKQIEICKDQKRTKYKKQKDAGELPEKTWERLNDELDKQSCIS